MTTSQTGRTSAYATAPGPAAEPTRPSAAAAPKARKARLVVSRVDPWSVMKLAALLSFVAAIIFVIAVAVLWEVLDGMGVFTSIATQVGSVTADPSGSGFDILSYLSLKKIVGGATMLALVDMVLLTALATLAAFVYNVSSSLVGGLHVTLTEDS